MARTRVLIAGAAGRDFHNFNLVYRDSPVHEVVAFTATQIPNIDGRRYPPSCGVVVSRGDSDPAESALEQLVREHEIDEVVFATRTSRTSTSCTSARARSRPVRHSS